jgi:hypothetical protein
MRGGRLICLVGIVNEPRIMQGDHVLYPDTVGNFYYEAYQQMRAVTGIGEGNGPFIVSLFSALNHVE